MALGDEYIAAGRSTQNARVVQSRSELLDRETRRGTELPVNTELTVEQMTPSVFPITSSAAPASSSATAITVACSS